MLTGQVINVLDACGERDCDSSTLIDGTGGPTCLANGPDCDCIPSYYPAATGSDCIREYMILFIF